MITIRPEKPEDLDTIYEINKKVFNTLCLKFLPIWWLYREELIGSWNVTSLSKGDKYIYRIRVLSVFIGKNSKALKRRKYKAFSVFCLYGMLVIPLKYGENEAKKG